MRTIDWREPATIVIVDQTRLPSELVTMEIRTVRELVGAVKRLAVRGALALGVVGALGAVLAHAQAEEEGWDGAHLRAEVDALKRARPTAANLVWGADEVIRFAREGRAAMKERALQLLQAETDACRAIGERGADLLSELGHGPLRIHTHCNTGSLACVEWGTALGVVRCLHRRGLLQGVLVDETRPLLQGARLTAWELEQDGIPYEVIVDAAGPCMISRGEVDAVVVGADRIAANGDVANKIGTYGLALAAARAGVPFVVAAPESTIDPSTPTGRAIAIEERPEAEVLRWADVPTAPPGAAARNPAFDVTPAELVTAIVTECRVVREPAGRLPEAVKTR